MKIDRKDTGNGIGTITVTVETADIKDKYNNSIKDYSRKASIKGFRKGKTPINFIKKMHGHSILADTINNVMQAELSNYIKSEELDLIGQPIPSETEKDQMSLDPFKLEDVTFNFDFAQAPKLKLKSAEDLGIYTTYDVQVPDAMIKEEIANGLKRLGSQDETEEAIIENDLVTVKSVELDGKNVKEEGHETEFSVLISMIKDEKAKKAFIGSKKGDSLDFNIYKLENGTTDDYVAKYLLKLDPENAASVGEMFRGEVIKVMRVTEAEKNAEFFKNFTGDESVDTEAKAKDAIRTNLKKHYNKESENLLKGKIASDLIEQHPVEFPEVFMKRWIRVATENAETLNIDQEYDAYAKQLQWTLIKSQLMEQHKVEVTEDDIKAAARERVLSYFGAGAAGVDEAMIEGIIPRLLNDQQQLTQIHTGVEFDKLMSALVKEVKTDVKSLNTDEFKGVVDAYNEEMKAKG